VSFRCKMRARAWCYLACVVAVLAMLASPQATQAESYDRFEGRDTPHFAPGTSFRVEREGPRWWFVTPEGGAFLSFGVNHISWQGDQIQHTDTRPYRDAVLAKYGTPEKWVEAACDRLRQWHFNTIGAWSKSELDGHLPRTPILHLTNSQWAECWKERRLPDFFDPAFVELVQQRAAQIQAHASDPSVIGYFIDNELPWAPDHRRTPELFDAYAAMPGDAPGKRRFVAFFQERYPTVQAFNKVWEPTLPDWSALATTSKLFDRDTKKAKADREAFTLLAARQFFAVTSEAIRANDPDALVLGCRFIPQSVPKAVVQACGEYCDVVSVNFYETFWGGKLFFWWKAASIDRMPQDGDLRAYYDVGKKPVMVSEFSFRARDSGMPNTWPPGYAVQPVVATQKDRAAKFDHYVMTWLSQPWFVGAHWFEHADEPKEGRANDGENGNYGLVNIEDNPYDEFVNAVAETILNAWNAHAQATEDGI